MAETAPFARERSCEEAKHPAPPPGLLGRLKDLLTCRRRAAGVKGGSSASSTSPRGYEELRKHAEKLTEEQKAAFKTMAWWSEVQTKTGAKVFVLAPRGERGDMEAYIDMWSLFAYAVSQMHENVVERQELFAVVWVQLSDHRVWPYTATVFKSQLHERYVRCLDAVHVVHPSWTVRLLRLALWPVASDEFWEQFQCHERVEFLEPFVSLKKLELPKEIYEHDKFLDTQADEMSKDAATQMNGRFGGSSMLGGMNKKVSEANERESQKYKAQMDNIQELLEEKGYGQKKSE